MSELTDFIPGLNMTAMLITAAIPTATNAMGNTQITSNSIEAQRSASIELSEIERRKNLPKGSLAVYSNISNLNCEVSSAFASTYGTNTTKANYVNSQNYDVNLSGFDFPAYYYDNLSTLWNDLDIQLEKYGQKVKVSHDTIKHVAFYVSSKLADLNSKDLLLELTPNNTIKYTLLFRDDIMVMIDKPVVPSEEYGVNDIFYSFFINRKLVSADVNDLDKFITGFKKYLSES